MEQYLEFATNNIWLVAAFMVVAAALAWNLITQAQDKSVVSPQEATTLINRSQAVVLDVRPMTDFNSGHIVNALNIPSNGLKDQLKKLAKYQQKPVIVACRSGVTSAGVCSTLRKAGYTEVYNLKGGMQAWEGANLPIKRSA
jgi:rhodanese-related sulfurtransferase